LLFRGFKPFISFKFFSFFNEEHIYYQILVLKVAYPKNPSKSEALCDISQEAFLRRGVVSPTPNLPKLEDRPFSVVREYLFSIFAATKIRIIILPVVLYGRETWSLTLREEHRLRVFENRVLRRIFVPKRDEVTEVRGNCIMRSFITFILRQV
jgi:hypothetical protein